MAAVHEPLWRKWRECDVSSAICALERLYIPSSASRIAQVCVSFVDVLEVTLVEGHPPHLVVLGLRGGVQICPELVAVWYLSDMLVKL